MFMVMTLNPSPALNRDCQNNIKVIVMHRNSHKQDNVWTIESGMLFFASFPPINQ